MYEEVFDDRKQTEMRRFFCDKLSKWGCLKSYAKGSWIDPSYCDDAFGIIVKGIVAKSIVSMQGKEKLLYLLRPGEIFGEMNLLGGGKLSYAVRAKEASQVAFVTKEVLERSVSDCPDAYGWLMHSMTRKFRIVLLQSTSYRFNDARGRIADALLRLSACSNEAPGKSGGFLRISSTFTQHELAQNVGCSRITVTRQLKEFIEEGVIRMENKKIVILNMAALASYTDRIL